MKKKKKVSDPLMDLMKQLMKAVKQYGQHQCNVQQKTDDWKTPMDIMKIFMQYNWIDCFPYQANYNQFEKDYYSERLYINPPYSKMKDVVKWIIKQYENKNEIIVIMPSRTDTKYFHELLNLKPVVYFIKGRLHYNESAGAPFPSVMLHFTKYGNGIYKHLNYEELKERIKQICVNTY